VALLSQMSDMGYGTAYCGGWLYRFGVDIYSIFIVKGLRMGEYVPLKKCRPPVGLHGGINKKIRVN